MSRNDATLLDLLKAARLAVEFKGKLAKKTFLRDVKTQSAILHQLLGPRPDCGGKIEKAYSLGIPKQ